MDNVECIRIAEDLRISCRNHLRGATESIDIFRFNKRIDALTYIIGKLNELEMANAGNLADDYARVQRDNERYGGGV